MDDQTPLPINFVSSVVKKWTDGDVTAESALEELLSAQEKVREDEDAN